MSKSTKVTACTASGVHTSSWSRHDGQHPPPPNQVDHATCPLHNHCPSLPRCPLALLIMDLLKLPSRTTLGSCPCAGSIPRCQITYTWWCVFLWVGFGSVETPKFSNSIGLVLETTDQRSHVWRDFGVSCFGWGSGGKKLQNLSKSIGLVLKTTDQTSHVWEMLGGISQNHRVALWWSFRVSLWFVEYSIDSSLNNDNFPEILNLTNYFSNSTSWSIYT